MGKYVSKKSMTKQDKALFEAIDGYLQTRCDDVFAKIMKQHPDIAAKAKAAREARQQCVR